MQLHHGHTQTAKLLTILNHVLEALAHLAATLVDITDANIAAGVLNGCFRTHDGRRRGSGGFGFPLVNAVPQHAVAAVVVAGLAGVVHVWAVLGGAVVDGLEAAVAAGVVEVGEVAHDEAHGGLVSVVACLLWRGEVG